MKSIQTLCFWAWSFDRGDEAEAVAIFGTLPGAKFNEDPFLESPPTIP
jgi:hypothetical protein